MNNNGIPTYSLIKGNNIYKSYIKTNNKYKTKKDVEKAEKAKMT